MVNGSNGPNQGRMTIPNPRCYILLPILASAVCFYPLFLICIPPFQGDTPVEKRPKLSTEVKGKAKMAKNMDFAQVERNEEPKLPLSANEKVFNIGSTREENKPNTGRTIRHGLEKEGPRGVIIGVPKPGKKRKFMEVSKHYVSDRTAKTNVPSDSMKLAKWGVRNTSNLDFKEKQLADSSKPRTTLKSGKPPSIPSRTFLRKDNSTSSRPTEHSAKGSISNDENESSDVGEGSEGTMVFSSQVLPRRKAARNTRPERLNQGKLAPVRGKLAKDEAAENFTSQVAEPRRSNRRIQPTSRVTFPFPFLFHISVFISCHICMPCLPK